MARQSPSAARPGAPAALIAFVAQSPLDLTMIDHEGCIIEMSRGALANAGAPRDKIVGKNVVEAFGVDRDRFADLLSGRIEKLPPQRIEMADGGINWIEATLS